MRSHSSFSTTQRHHQRREQQLSKLQSKDDVGGGGTWGGGGKVLSIRNKTRLAAEAAAAAAVSSTWLSNADFTLAVLAQYPVQTETHIFDPSCQFAINQFPVYVINLSTDDLRRQYIKQLFKKMCINYCLVQVEAVSPELFQEVKQRFAGDVCSRVGELGCCLSHLWCLQHAESRGHEHFIIMEDDVVFHREFHDRLADLLRSRVWSPSCEDAATTTATTKPKPKMVWTQRKKNVAADASATVSSPTPPPLCDLVMLGACDFKFASTHFFYMNHAAIRAQMKMPAGTYVPTHNVFGGHANLYSRRFARAFFHHKIQRLNGYDGDYSVLYKTHRVCVCYPNLVLCELSTSHLQHHYGFLTPKAEDRYYASCFKELQFQDYPFLYIDVLKKMRENRHWIRESTTLAELLDRVLPLYSPDVQAKLRARVDTDFFTLDDVKCICGTGM